MLDNITGNITKIFDSLRSKKTIGENDLNNTMREIRIALLEADVALSVAKDFIEKVKAKALGQEVVKSVTAGQMIVKIIHDELVELLGSEKSQINLSAAPAVVMMVGLQGSGKTTTTAKLALRLKNKNHKKVLLASLDTYRPAAQRQLEILAQQLSVDVVPIVANENPLQIAKRAMTMANSYEVLILDSAGRNSIDEMMMDELQQVKALTNPAEILLVVDALTGQDAINTAKNFHEKLSVNGIVLTRLDGDSRGGAALTMKAATGCAIKFIGVGEKSQDLEEFDPQRIASRIIGMGDVVSLVERAQEVFDKDEMEKAVKKFKSQSFDLDDLLAQMRNMKKIGGLNSIISFLPGAAQLKENMAQLKTAEKEIKLQEALILSMTKAERRKPDILSSSRKMRIAKGAGSTMQEVNRLLKKYKQMQKVMGKFGKMDPKKLEEMGKMMEGR